MIHDSQNTYEYDAKRISIARASYEMFVFRQPAAIKRFSLEIEAAHFGPT